jgi:hypothetical protein
MLFESHRVLRPAGHLVITTPNVVRTEKLKAMLEGGRIGDAYHGNGIYGRHNREYAPPEVPQLIESCGYSVVRHETIDVYDTSSTGAQPGREDTIVTVGRATGPRRIGTPPGLYVLMDEYLNVIRSAFTMGIDEVGQLGRGWYDLEAHEALGFRWMCKTATFHLNTDRALTVGVHLQAHHPDLSHEPVRLRLSVEGQQASQTVRDHRWQDVEFHLARPISGPVAIELTADRDWVPADTAVSTDTRRLGVRVHRCWSK